MPTLKYKSTNRAKQFNDGFLLRYFSCLGRGTPGPKLKCKINPVYHAWNTYPYYERVLLWQNSVTHTLSKRATKGRP